jgi:hypothetical protein
MPLCLDNPLEDLMSPVGDAPVPGFLDNAATVERA